ncbi:MBL fold metallo-hydrolase [Gorillibacterium sp. CAU 1737]|uniref:MBL fold metallo-hydrolase n=1 Tax=Gorillibacterium sp. CAU 1737 TaxID=3140362 RepID=UPI0032617185
MSAWVSRHFGLEKVAEGVYAAIATEHGGAMGNAGFVDLGDRVVIFDTFNAPQAAQDLKEAAVHFTGHDRFILVNSHWHGDHIRGNQAFDAKEIYASPITREWIEREHPGRIERQQSMLPQLALDIAELEGKLAALHGEETQAERITLHQQVSFLREMQEALPQLRLVPPTHSVEHEQVLTGSARSIRLVTCGAGHSPSDLVMEVPDCGILFAGDLVSIDNHPMLDGGDPWNWVNILEMLESNGYTTVIPGHGPVGAADSISVQRQYLKTLIDLASRISEEESMPEPYMAWKADFLYKPNLAYIRAKAAQSVQQ